MKNTTGCGTTRNLAVFAAAMALGITGGIALLAICCGIGAQIMQIIH